MGMRILIVASLFLASCTSVATTGTTAGTDSTPPTTVPPISTTMPPSTSSVPEPSHERWYLVSVTASLPDGLSAGLRVVDGVHEVSTATVGTLHLVESSSQTGAIVDESPDGFVIPLEAQAFYPASRAGVVPPPVESALTNLGAGEVILSRSSAALRRLGVGSRLILDDGTTLSVTHIVDDEWVGDAEVVVSNDDAVRLGITNERYSIVLYEGEVEDLDRDANALVNASVRVRSRDEVDMFRHADAVASQLAVKTRFGEFAFRPARGDAIEINPAWLDANILHGHIPLLGDITCHKEFVALLREVMTSLEEAGYSDAIDRSAFKGCWNPRFIRGRTDLSRHAWGVAAHINFGNDLDGQGSPTDPRLLSAMAELGILSGHTWTNPDPGHFEWFPQDD